MRSLYIMATMAIVFLTQLIAVSYAQTDKVEFSSGYKNGGVCFYSSPGFKGRKFCARSKEKFTRLTSKWNNDFSSIQLDPGMAIYACQLKNFQGRCGLINSAKKKLSARWDKKISSIHIAKKANIYRIARAYEDKNRNANAEDEGNQEVAQRDEPEKQEQQKQESQREPEITEERDITEVEERPRRRIASGNNLFDDDEDYRSEDLSYHHDRDREEEERRNNKRNTSDLNPRHTSSIHDSEQDLPLVCFYTKASYRGQRFCYEISKALYELPYRWNDRISSISISGPASIRLCRDAGLEGECTTVRRSLDYMGRHWSNSISSLEVVMNPSNDRDTVRQVPDRNRQNFSRLETETLEDPEEVSEVCFFEKKKYKGRSFCVPLGRTLNSLRGRKDDSISSFRIHGKIGLKVEICTDAYLGGECQTFYENKRFVGWTLNDKISSLRVRKDRRRR